MKLNILNQNQIRRYGLLCVLLLGGIGFLAFRGFSPRNAANEPSSSSGELPGTGSLSGAQRNAGFTAERDASGLSDVNAWSEPEQEPSISDVQAGDAVEEGAGDVRTQGLSEESGSDASGSVKIGPEQARGQQFPALPFSFYAKALDPEMQAALADWLEAHPEVDLSVMEAFEEAASAKRSTFPARLTLEEREQMAAWMERFESLKLEMVRVRAEVFDLAVSGVEASGRGFFLEGFTPEGQARYTFTSNREAAISTGASFVRRSESSS